VDHRTSLESRLKTYGQEHVMEFWDDLTEEEQSVFARELEGVDLKRVNQLSSTAINNLHNAQLKKDDRIEPLPDDVVGRIATSSPEQVQQWNDLGLQKISEGTVAVLLLAGGQGTRLGVSYPKGMYDVGLPSGKTLYHLQAERILKIQQLANEKYGTTAVIKWYIMTSEATLKDTKVYFKKHNYFGLKSSDVTFFEQHLLPCLTFEGKLMLSSKGSLAQSPDGNGGLYRALKTRGVLKSFEVHGIEHVYVYCVDNILVKVADPVFIGFCIHNNLDCGNKVIKKMSPHEAVGVVCKCEGTGYEVVEYSEITAHTAEKRNPLDGSLLFDASNICIHYFTVDFLNKICTDHLTDLPHHIAKKKIPHVSPSSGGLVIPTSPNGMKLEKFVFDVFPFASNFGVLEGDRSVEFSPLKNGPDNPKSSPVSCRNDLLRLHEKFLVDAGAELVVENGCSVDDSPPQVEISPLLSYAGEGLEKINKCKVNVRTPVNLETLSSLSL